MPGNRANTAELQWARAAVLTAGDVLTRLGVNSTGQGVGLRGGDFRVVNDSSIIRVTLNQVRWTEDLTVSGTIEKPASRTGRVRAVLRLSAADGQSGELAVQWREGVAGSRAAVQGTLGGSAVCARTAAP